MLKKGATQLIKRLSELRMIFAPEQAAEKERILQTLRTMTIASPSRLTAYHEALCFMQAYPDNESILRLVDEELAGFGDRIVAYKKQSGDETSLDETAIAQTAIHHPYTLDMARWLMKRFGGGIDIDWDDFDEKETDPLTPLLSEFALYVENDGIDDPEQAISDWMKMAVGGGNSLQWLIGNLDRLSLPAGITRYLYDNAEFRLAWRVGNTRGARTHAKLPAPMIHYQRSGIQKQKTDLHESIQKPAPALRTLSHREAAAAIETMNLALMPRLRELWPATYANPDEGYVSPLDNGTEIYLFGMLPEFRMPLETNYAALLMRNGVPIGYGIGVTLFAQCEIAINQFETFRSGEAGTIFEHFFRIFYHHFGARDFLVRKWQAGYENDEGLESGSYWFYYKLGFRSIDDKVNRLAREEREKIRNIQGYRSDRRMLKRLSVSDLHLSPGQVSRGRYEELRVTELGYAVTREVAANFAGDRVKALKHFVRRLRNAGIDPVGFTKGEREQFERLCPLLALIDDLPAWSVREKRDLLGIIKAKAAAKEQGYVLKLQTHARLLAAVKLLASRR